MRKHLAEMTREKAFPPPKTKWLFSIFTILSCLTLAKLMAPYFAIADLVMVFLLGIGFVAARWGRGPSLLATVLSVALFDFFFVPPFHTFIVSEPKYLLTFGVLFLVGHVISRLTSTIKEQADLAKLREQRTAALYGLSRDLVQGSSLSTVIAAVTRHLSDVLNSRIEVFLSTSPGKIRQAAPDGLTEIATDDLAAVEWVFQNGQSAGIGTGSFAQATGYFLPLMTSSRPVGVIGVWQEREKDFSADQVQLLEALADQTAQAIERVFLAEETQQAMLAAERESLRSTMLSSVSHDLRTPLAAITGAGTTLLHEGDQLDTEGRKELLQTIVEEAAHLNGIIRNVLDMTRLESGGIQISKEWQSLEEIVGAVLNRMSAQLANHSLSLVLPADLPLIPCDALMIEQLLRNLLENATKYSPSGTNITISALRREDEILVQVADEGSGISSEEAERVFDKFHRGKNALGGVGLGLAICRGILSAHDGRIWAERSPGGGAQVSFTLPIEQVPPAIEKELEG